MAGHRDTAEGWGPWVLARDRGHGRGLRTGVMSGHGDTAEGWGQGAVAGHGVRGHGRELGTLGAGRA